MARAVWGPMALPLWARPLRAELRQRWLNRGYRRRGLDRHGMPVLASAWPAPGLSGWCWGSCTTPVKRRGDARADADRLHNMALAIAQLDGLLLGPGQVLSFWQHVPPPLARHGYRAGPMLVGGELRWEIGGGLCQVSTTLFGALLQAGCTLLEHSNHSRDAHGEDRFFTLGQDAAVAYGFKNLLARNDHDQPLQLRLALSGAGAGLQLQAALWGPAPAPLRVRLESRRVDLPGGADPAAPAVVETCRWLAPAAAGDAPGWQLDYHYLYTYLPPLFPSP